MEKAQNGNVIRLNKVSKGEIYSLIELICPYCEDSISFGEYYQSVDISEDITCDGMVTNVYECPHCKSPITITLYVLCQAEKAEGGQEHD